MPNRIDWNRVWIIAHDGSIAWKWTNTSRRVPLADADAFKADREAAGDIVHDDRGKPFANVWN